MNHALDRALSSLGLTPTQTQEAPAPTSTTSTTNATNATGAAKAKGADRHEVEGHEEHGHHHHHRRGEHSLKHDTRAFMHAVFQAMKGAEASPAQGGVAGSSGSGGAAGPSATDATAATTATEATASDATASSTRGRGARTDFAARLSTLIAQVSGGSAPPELQSAFTQLMSHFQGAGTATPPTAPTATPPGTPAGGGTTGTEAPATTPEKPAVTLQSLLTQFQQNLGYGASSSGTAVGSTFSTRV